MPASARTLLAIWFFLIAGFCVYGFLATYEMPGESFCRTTYTVLIVLSSICIAQVVEPIRERLIDVA